MEEERRCMACVLLPNLKDLDANKAAGAFKLPYKCACGNDMYIEEEILYVAKDKNSPTSGAK